MARRYIGLVVVRSHRRMCHPVASWAILQTVSETVRYIREYKTSVLYIILYIPYTVSTIMYSVFGLLLFLGLVFLVICLLQK